MTTQAAPEDETLTRVRTIVAEQLARDVAQVMADSRIVADLGADSLDIAELMLVLEEAFNTNIPEASALDLTTVGDVARFVDRLLADVALGSTHAGAASA